MSAPYDAFVSYSHAQDKPVAGALQAVMQRLGKPWYKRRALRIFRDDTSLSATPSLWPSIEAALAQSRYLIVLASPQFAASKWCGMEVAYWLEHKNLETLLIALTEGDLFWDEAANDFRWDAATPLPASLQGRFAHEPKWIDLRAHRDAPDARDAKFIDAGADFAAAIHGIPKEDLLSQELRQQKRALTLAWSAAAVLLALVGAAITFWLWASQHVAAFRERVRQGFAVLRPPHRYLTRVVPWQALDWAFRLATIYCLLLAFGIEANLRNALLVQVAQGLSTILPLTPAGIGTEQALLAYVFRGIAGTAAVLSFSVGMKLVLIVVNVAVGLTALLLMLRTLRWRAAVAAERAAAGAAGPGASSRPTSRR